MYHTQRARARRESAPTTTRFAGDKLDVLQGGASISWVGYERASKDDQKQGKSIADQRAVNVGHADRYSWTHAASFSDNDLGASRQARARGVVRKGFDDLVTYIRSGAAGDVLIIWELARRERDMAVFVAIRDLCLEVGPYFWLVGGTLYDLRNRHDRSSLGFQAQIAEGGADAIDEGVTRGLHSNAMQGKPHGPIPFGYKRVYNPRTRVLIKQELDWDTFYISETDERIPRTDGCGVPWSPAGIVQAMYEDVRSGVPLTAIVNTLNDRKIPTPRQQAAIERSTPLGPERWSNVRWTHQVVRMTLMNPAYAGIRLYHGEPVFEDSWEALISADDLDTLTRVLDDPERITNKGASVAKYLLSCIAECGNCGNVMVYNKAPVKATFPQYRCRRGDSAIPAPALEEFVERRMVYLLSDEEELSRILAQDADAPQIAAARDLVERLRANLNDYQQRWRRDALSDDDYEFRRAELLPQIAAAEQQMCSVELPDELQRFKGTDVDTAASLWDELELSQQRTLIRAVLDIRVHPVGKGRRKEPILVKDRVTITTKQARTSV